MMIFNVPMAFPLQPQRLVCILRLIPSYVQLLVTQAVFFVLIQFSVDLPDCEPSHLLTQLLKYIN